MSWNLLKRFIESDVFNQSPFLCVAYLSRYADHVGIHYVLCSKLRQFSYEEIEFFLPQLCHLIISVNNESMALEEFVFDLCEDSVNATLLTFWLFQTYLHDLSSNPQSEAFKTCRRIFNKVQNIVFGVSHKTINEKINENPLPVTVLASFILASVGAPFLPVLAGPMAIGQARKPQPDLDPIVGANQNQQKFIPSTNLGPSRLRTPTVTGDENVKFRREMKVSRAASLRNPPLSSTSGRRQQTDSRPRPSHLDLRMPMGRRSSSSSLPPDQRSLKMIVTNPSPPVTACLSRPSHFSHSTFSHITPITSPFELSEAQQIKLLRQNYFRCETQFITALENISNRLVVVPKPARLSALRAELALIAQDLPAEVDIPVICPATLVDGAPNKSRHHRIVRLNPAEATILNSAEKVPFLLMVEILRDDFSFDPSTSDNQALLAKLIFEQESGRRRIFDLSEAVRTPNYLKRYSDAATTSFKINTEDSSNLTSPKRSDDSSEHLQIHQQQLNHNVGLPSGQVTPRSQSFSESYPNSISNRMSFASNTERKGSSAQIDLSALATHMRTASQMLAQLETTSRKRPKNEVAAIRAKIIASMQSLEDQIEDKKSSFEAVVDKANKTDSEEKLENKRIPDGVSENFLNAEAGVARMENDQMTGGFLRKGDQDDPSAASFGEAWSIKRERIRKSSPYGWMKNWDVLSVIVKTGADLRQEAFACQLIQVCHDIWKEAKIPVWVKCMRIFVTGESSGLIETITNGVSLHSLKRSLTLATIEEGNNIRKKIASLKDHFIKAYGSPEREPYKAAVDAFKRSLAAYSIISYVLQLKDRHNGNVLIDNEGHIIHIDFGFMLSNSPGSVAFEAAPFKLTQDYVDVLGGVRSEDFEDYKKLCKQAFQALRRSADHLIDLVNLTGRESKMPCFSYGVQQAVTSLRQRFQLQLSADEAEQYVETDLIGKSLGSYYTRLYDTFQYRTQGIY
ncbi:Phosphatidylinositol 4-kinase [Podosphaera aphanis]|nr:Phosphatidylinositol 4-kinase [Podosphaera aphanis]